MELRDLSELVAGLPGSVEEQPFGPQVDVFKVGGRIFAILSPEEQPERISLKCEPMLALELRERYDAVQPGYHLNKVHWNTIVLDGSIADGELRAMVRRSYERVVAGLTRSQRAQIGLDSPA
jgi:predicted DNA-binding protein (MmcQ/YjbR family)